jgi:hypothetical protein
MHIGPTIAGQCIDSVLFLLNPVLYSVAGYAPVLMLMFLCTGRNRLI